MPTRGKTKITNLDVGNAVSTDTDEYIFRLQISMHEIVEAMDVNDPFHNLTKQPPDLLCVLMQALGYQISKRLKTWVVSKKICNKSLAKGHLGEDLLVSRSTP